MVARQCCSTLRASRARKSRAKPQPGARPQQITHDSHPHSGQESGDHVDDAVGAGTSRRYWGARLSSVMQPLCGEAGRDAPSPLGPSAPVPLNEPSPSLIWPVHYTTSCYQISSPSRSLAALSSLSLVRVVLNARECEGRVGTSAGLSSVHRAPHRRGPPRTAEEGIVPVNVIGHVLTQPGCGAPPRFHTHSHTHTHVGSIAVQCHRIEEPS